MTLIVAIGCTDGIVMAADSASTDFKTQAKQPATKVKPLPGRRILYGGAGDVGVLQKIDASLGAQVRENAGPFVALRGAIQAAVVAELRRASALHVPQPDPGFRHPPAATLLFGIIYGQQSYLLEVERDGRDTLFGPEFGNFGAIGSGKALAQALMRPHLLAERDLLTGRVLAYRIVEDAIALAAWGLAEPVRLHTLALDGTVSEIGDFERRELRETCELWRQRERDALALTLAPPAVEDEFPPRPRHRLQDTNRSDRWPMRGRRGR